MILSPELADYIVKYNYLAVFSLVFLQELGVPNPVPNEIILLFVGYLASVNILNFPLILLTSISADIIGTSILYTVFYFFGNQILKYAPRWLPIKKIEALKQHLSKRGDLDIFLGRLLPYLRGYISVAAGLLKIPAKKFLSSVIVSAVVWTGGYVIAGRLLGKGWDKLATRFSAWQLLLLIAVIAILVFFIIKSARKISKKTDIETDHPTD
jgi:membrane protein DedA with SNARE-associated domain